MKFFPFRVKPLPYLCLLVVDNRINYLCDLVPVPTVPFQTARVFVSRLAAPFPSPFLKTITCFESAWRRT